MRSLNFAPLIINPSLLSIDITLVQSWWQYGVRFGHPKFDIICTNYMSIYLPSLRRFIFRLHCKLYRGHLVFLLSAKAVVRKPLFLILIFLKSRLLKWAPLGLPKLDSARSVNSTLPPIELPLYYYMAVQTGPSCICPLTKHSPKKPRSKVTLHGLPTTQLVHPVPNGVLALVRHKLTIYLGSKTTIHLAPKTKFFSKHKDRIELS